MANAFFPVHILWPSIRARVPPGDHISSSANARNFNRIFRASLRKLQVGDSDSYSSHGFRRGTAQDLETNGSPWAVVATAGLWNSPDFRGYVGRTADVEQGVRNLFAVGPDSESE